MLYGALWLFVGFLFVGLGIPLHRKSVPPNHWYGFRTRDTLASSEIWYEVNSLTGRDLIWLGIVVLLVGAVLGFVVGVASPVSGIAIAAVLLVGVVVCLVRGSNYVRAAKARVKH